VALPTGLGKTFVAGVVMLNCKNTFMPSSVSPFPAKRRGKYSHSYPVYRWFPTGKIVFLAPTKPLVNQQIEACQLACGIPSKDAAVMTGSSVSAKERTRLVSWQASLDVRI
jgi:ATP-dependent DNA helicase MPH1